MRGCMARAMASSSCRRSPCDSAAAGTAARSARPVCVSASIAAAFSAASDAAGRRKRKDDPLRACTASAAFSSAVKPGSTEVIWKLRARPSRARRASESAVTSRPAKTTRPASGRKVPLTWWISVVLPAPFGPMTAWISPGRTSSETPSVTASPPKRLRNPSRRRIGSATARAQQADQPAAQEQHGQHQQRAEDEPPMRGQMAQPFLQPEDRQRAEHRAEGAAEPAEDDHEQQVAGTLPGEEGGRDELRRVRQQEAGEARDAAG